MKNKEAECSVTI